MENQKQEPNNPLDSFAWDENVEFTFTEPQEVEEVKEETKVDTEEKPKVKTKEEPKVEETEVEDKEEDKEPEFTFGVEDEEVETTEEKETEISEYGSLAKQFVDEGIFELDEDSEINLDDLSKEDFLELQETQLEKRVDESFKDFFSEMDEDAKAFLKWKREGGNTSEFFDVLNENSSLIEINVEDEKGAERFLRKYLAKEGDSDEDIDDTIEYYKDKGKLTQYAKKNQNKEKAKSEKTKKAKLEEAQRVRELQAKEAKKIQGEIKKIIDDSDEINGWDIPKKQKSKLYDFMVGIDKKTKKTGLQSKLAEVFSDKEKLILLSNILMNDFDISSIERKAESKVTKKAKDKIIGKGKTSGKKRTTLDYF
jgi:hypothetical protein